MVDGDEVALTRGVAINIVLFVSRIHALGVLTQVYRITDIVQKSFMNL